MLKWEWRARFFLCLFWWGFCDFDHLVFGHLELLEVLKDDLLDELIWLGFGPTIVDANFRVKEVP